MVHIGNLGKLRNALASCRGICSYRHTIYGSVSHVLVVCLRKILLLLLLRRLLLLLLRLLLHHHHHRRRRRYHHHHHHHHYHILLVLSFGTRYAGLFNFTRILYPWKWDQYVSLKRWNGIATTRCIIARRTRFSSTSRRKFKITRIVSSFFEETVDHWRNTKCRFTNYFKAKLQISSPSVRHYLGSCQLITKQTQNVGSRIISKPNYKFLLLLFATT